MLVCAGCPFSEHELWRPGVVVYASQYNAAQAPVVTAGGGFVTDANGVPLNSAGTAANLSTALVFAGQNGVPDGFFDAKLKNFAPRVGFAYDPTGDGKTSIRAGYGIGYSRLAVEAIYNAFGQNSMALFLWGKQR